MFSKCCLFLVKVMKIFSSFTFACVYMYLLQYTDSSLEHCDILNLLSYFGDAAVKCDDLCILKTAVIPQ